MTTGMHTLSVRGAIRSVEMPNRCLLCVAVVMIKTVLEKRGCFGRGKGGLYIHIDYTIHESEIA
jgi:hypothetical protein